MYTYRQRSQQAHAPAEPKSKVYATVRGESCEFARMPGVFRLFSAHVRVEGESFAVQTPQGLLVPFAVRVLEPLDKRDVSLTLARTPYPEALAHDWHGADLAGHGLQPLAQRPFDGGHVVEGVFSAPVCGSFELLYFHVQ